MSTKKRTLEERYLALDDQGKRLCHEIRQLVLDAVAAARQEEQNAFRLMVDDHLDKFSPVGGRMIAEIDARSRGESGDAA